MIDLICILLFLCYKNIVQGVTFRIDEVELSSELRGIYNRSVEYWVELLQKFTEAADLIDAEKNAQGDAGPVSLNCQQGANAKIIK